MLARRTTRAAQFLLKSGSTVYVVAKTSDACLQDKPQEPLDCRDGSSCMQLGTISQTSQSEVAAVGRSPIGRDRVALGCLWILQGPALEEEAWEAREGLDELPARASTEGAG